MKVHRFPAFPDPFRRSMKVYADKLKEATDRLVAAEDSVVDVLPKPACLTPKPLRYFSQYVLYPFRASTHQGDVNHVLDHAYGHLVHHLNAARTVVTFHDAIRYKWVYDERPDFHPVRSVLEWNLRGIVKAACVIFDSEAARKDFLQMTQYPQSQTAVIPLGVDEAFFSPAREAAAKLRIKGAEMVLLHVGHTGAYKNIDALFYVLAKLRALGRNVHLMKVGMPFTPDQRRLAEVMGLWPLIHHLGKIEEVALPAVYQAADALLFPSLDEGFGFPVLEAMASGIPVIASARGSLVELAADPGFLVEPEDHDTMVLRVLELLKHPDLRKRLCETGKKKAAGYTWAQTAKATLEVYRKIVRSDL